MTEYGLETRQPSHKVTPSAGKDMATVCWASKGVKMTNYLPKSGTVTCGYYADDLHKLHEALKSKCLQRGFSCCMIMYHLNIAMQTPWYSSR